MPVGSGRLCATKTLSMSKQKFGLRILLMTIWAAVVAAGCARRDDTPFGSEGDAEVYLSVGLDNTENEQAISKAGQPTLDPDKDLAVYVINTHEDTLARWASFESVPSTLKFTPGAYKIVAEYKPEGVDFPAFESYAYRAEEKFVVKSKDKLHIDLVAKLAAAKISVEFDDNFDFYYQSYSVDIRTVGTDSLRFGKGETRCGFFEPGSVRMRFNLVTPEGQRLVFSPEPLAKANAADWYKLKLKVSSDQGSTQVIVIGTDDELNPEKDVTVEVPRYFLPKDKPVFEAVGFVSGTEQSVFEGEVPKWSMSARTPGGISSFVIRLNDGAGGVLASKLGATEIDLAGLGGGDPLRDKLKAAGFVWSEGLNSPEDAAISTSVFIDFTDAMKAAESGSAAYDFQFEVTDNYGQSPEAGPCVVKAEVKAPTVRFAAIAAADMWATRAFFTVRANYDLSTGTRPVLQYRKTASENWNDAVEGDDLTVTEAAVGGDGFYAARYELKGLQANTEYQFRISANGKEIAPETGSDTWRTEEALPVPGLVDGGFASGWNEAAATTALGVTVQAPPAGWATRNPLTTSQRELSVNPNTGEGTVEWSEVSANNGVVLVANPGNPIRKAVQLRTTGWGQGCYSKTGGDEEGSMWTGGGSPALGARVRNTSAALLYLGSYVAPESLNSNVEEWSYYTALWTKKTVNYPYETYIEGTEVINETGAAFASRPATLSFQYKFTPSTDGSPKEFLIRAEVYAEDGTKIGGVSWNDGTAVANMKDHTLNIEYTDKTKKAATIKLFFSSDVRWEQVGTPNGGPDYTVSTNGDPHIGNTLVIDNVELGYEFK